MRKLFGTKKPPGSNAAVKSRVIRVGSTVAIALAFIAQSLGSVENCMINNGHVTYIPSL